MLGLNLRCAGQFFGDGGQDLHTLDRIDAEVAFQIHVGVDGFGGVAGFLGDDGNENRQYVALCRIRHAGCSRDGRLCR